MFRTRDTIIRQEVAKCGYTAGDFVRPVVDSEFKQWGIGRVKGIVKGYKDWPAHIDFPHPPTKPLIVLVEQMEKAGSYNCTASYVRKATEEESKHVKTS